jgi:selenocysteine lyase/cysteine desulfurase
VSRSLDLAARPAPAAPVEPRAFRSRFPLLERKVHLAACSLGPRSDDMDAALAQMLEDMASGGAPWGLFEQQVEEARARFAALIGASTDQVAVVPNASVGAYQVASGFDWRCRSRIVTSAAEFPSVAHVWLAQAAGGADIVFADSPAREADVVDEQVALVSVPLISFRDGERQPVADLARRAHDAGALVFVDAYQAVGVERVDVRQLDCDYLVAGTMKYLLGLPGLAFLYVRSPEDVDLTPRLTGWFGRIDPFAFDPRLLDFPADARRFQTGTAAVPACYGSNAGLRLIDGLDLDDVHEHVLALTALADERLTAMGETVRAARLDRRGAHIGLVDADPQRLAATLAERDVVVSPRGDVVRLAFHYYSGADDVEALCDAVAASRRLPGTTRQPIRTTEGR